MGHVGRAVGCEQFQRLYIGQVTLAAPYALPQVVGVTTVFEHGIVVVGLEKCCMALGKMVLHLLAGLANICEHPYTYATSIYHKTVRVYGIVVLSEARNTEPTYSYWLQGRKVTNKISGRLGTAAL